MIHCFFSSQVRCKYLSIFSLPFIFNLWTERQNLLDGIFFYFFFFFISFSLGLLAGIKWSVFISKSQRIFCTSFPWTDFGLSTYHLFLWVNYNFLHNSQWITFPTQSRLILNSFIASLQHSFIMRSTISCLYILLLRSCYVLLIFALT